MLDPADTVGAGASPSAPSRPADGCSADTNSREYHQAKAECLWEKARYYQERGNQYLAGTIQAGDGSFDEQWAAAQRCCRLADRFEALAIQEERLAAQSACETKITTSEGRPGKLRTARGQRLEERRERDEH